MNIALVIAGGSGARMGQDVPKQFLSVYDKPVIVYTLEVFEKHPDINGIAVVCIQGWHEILQAYALQFKISKLRWIFPGGENGQISIRNGVFGLEKECDPDDIVLVHDAIRPLVSQEIISDCISKCRMHGSAIVSIDCAEAMLRTKDKLSASAMVPRDELMRTQTPQAFKLAKLIWAHKEAASRAISNSISSCTLMIELGESVYFSMGSEKNLKLTTTDDIDIFKSLLKTERTDWLK